MLGGLWHLELPEALDHLPALCWVDRIHALVLDIRAEAEGDSGQEAHDIEIHVEPEAGRTSHSTHSNGAPSLSLYI